MNGLVNNRLSEHKIFSCACEKYAPITFHKISYDSDSPSTTPLYKERISRQFELFIIAGRHISIMVNDLVFAPNWGDVIIIRKGDSFQPLCTVSDNTHYYKVSFSDEFIRKQPAASPFYSLFTSDKFKEYSLIDTSIETSYALFEHIKSIENALDSKNEGGNLSAFFHLTDLANCICSEPLLNFKVPSDYISKKIPPALHNALQYIFSNYLKIKSTPEIAEESHISVTYLCRIFRKHMNCSPVDFINSCKISHAKHLLICGHKATEACYLSGFNNYNYFADVFRKNVGSSPRQFAKNYGHNFVFVSENPIDNKNE